NNGGLAKDRPIGFKLPDLSRINPRLIRNLAKSFAIQPGQSMNDRWRGVTLYLGGVLRLTVINFCDIRVDELREAIFLRLAPKLRLCDQLIIADHPLLVRASNGHSLQRRLVWLENRRRRNKHRFTEVPVG